MAAIFEVPLGFLMDPRHHERRLIEEALAAAGGNQRRAAAALKTLPTTLHEKMKRLGLKPRAARPEGEDAALEGDE